MIGNNQDKDLIRLYEALKESEWVLKLIIRFSEEEVILTGSIFKSIVGCYLIVTTVTWISPRSVTNKANLRSEMLA